MRVSRPTRIQMNSWLVTYPKAKRREQIASKRINVLVSKWALYTVESNYLYEECSFSW